MANFNRVILIGRLTRDPETKTFGSGGMVTNFGFVTNGRKKQGSEWVDDPMFIDVAVFNRGEFGKLADLVRDRCKKGTPIMIEGKLSLEQWDDKSTGAKRSKHKIVADQIQLLEPRSAGDRQATGRDDGPPDDDGGNGVPF